MRRCAAVLAAVVLVSGLSGCSRLLGQRYDNFTAYYNTYYNAKREFIREEEQLLKAERPVERDQYLTLFVEPDQPGGSTEGGFTKAIEKGADLLREHPESKWVDDALLLIGKAYFYQANFTGAEQKFREIIALDEDQLEDEARLWLGRTLTITEQYDTAALALREGLDRGGVREEWASKMRLALAEVDAREGEWEEAIESLRAGLDGLRDDALAARGAFLLGQIYETVGQPAEAAEAYGRALRRAPRYQLAFAAQLSHALALGLSGEGDRALEELSRMRRDDKNLEDLAEVELARARVLAAMGRPDEARELMRTLLYDPDPTLRVGNVRGQIHYRLAEVYRDGLRDYVRAAAHYDTAATTIRQVPLLDEQVTVQAIADAPARAEAFGSYARVAAEIAEMDSLLYLGSLDDDAFAEAIEQIRAQREREERERARDLARRRSEEGFQGGGQGFGQDGGRGATSEQQPENTNAGFLNFRNPVQVQEELIAFQARWGERPLVPNWRRAAAIGGSVEVQEGVAETLAGMPQIQTPDYSRNDLVDISGIPRDALAQQQMRASRAAARYELGNVLFLSLSEPDSAAVLYRRVVEDNPDSLIAQRAYFALAEAQRALGNTVEAEQLYSDVIDRYPDSRFADQARIQLGFAPVERIAAADSVGLAEAAYAAAYERWKDGEYAEALNQMLALSDAYPTTTSAARARLAAGALYTEWAAGNEEALLAPEPAVLWNAELSTPEATPAEPNLADTANPFVAPAQRLTDSEAQPADAFGWVVASEPDSTAAADIALGYREQGFDAYVVPADTEYHVGIGQFPGRVEALAARTALPDDVPSDTWLLALPAGVAPSASAAPIPTPDTTQASASLPVVPVDSIGVAADSALVAADSVLVAADSVEAPVEDPWLDVLYASIEEDFPGTPFAERARTLRGALEGVRGEGALGASGVVDSAAVVDQSLRGDAPIELREGTFAWSIFALPDRESVEAMLENVADEGYRTALFIERDLGAVTYHVVVGQFGSQAEAEAEAVSVALAHIPDVLEYRLIPLSPEGELEQLEDVLRRRDQ